MRVAPVAALLLLSGCVTSMVRSYEAPPNSRNLPHGAEFLGHYGLPSSRIVLTIKATSAAKSGGDKTEDKSASISFNSEITVNNEKKPAAVNSTDGAKETPTETVATVCARLRKNYLETAAVLIAAHERNANMLSRVTQWQSSSPTNASAKDAAKEVETYLPARAADEAAISKAVNLAPRIRTDCPQAITATVEHVVWVNEAATYSLYSNRPVLAENRVTLDLEKGYIKSLAASSEDYTGKVVVDSVTSLGALRGLALPKLSGGGLEASNTNVETALDRQLRTTGRALIAALTPRFNAQAVTASLGEYREQLVLAVAASKDRKLDPIDPPLPYVVTLDLKTLSGSVVGQVTNVALPTPADKFDGLSLTSRCAPSVGTISTQPDEAEIAERKKDGLQGIVVSGSKACTLTVSLANQAPVQINFVAADADNPSLLPVTHQAFVKEVSNYTFADGRLTKSDTVRPSPALAFASLPGDAIGGFFGGIVKGISGKKSVIEAETAKIKASQERIKEAAALEDLKEKVAKADADDVADDAGTAGD